MSRRPRTSSKKSGRNLNDTAELVYRVFTVLMAVVFLLGVRSFFVIPPQAKEEAAEIEENLRRQQEENEKRLEEARAEAARRAEEEAAERQRIAAEKEAARQQAAYEKEIARLAREAEKEAERQAREEAKERAAREKMFKDVATTLGKELTRGLFGSLKRRR